MKDDVAVNCHKLGMVQYNNTDTATWSYADADVNPIPSVATVSRKVNLSIWA